MRHLWYDRQGKEIALMEWATLREKADYLCVALDRVGDVEVSTVWLGLDHNYAADGPPLIFETAVFGGPEDMTVWRYASEAEAHAAHVAIVESLRIAAEDQIATARKDQP